MITKAFMGMESDREPYRHWQNLTLPILLKAYNVVMTKNWTLEKMH
jgi:hypothetical protein